MKGNYVFRQEIHIDEDGGFRQAIDVDSADEPLNGKKLDYRPIVQEILKIGMRAFKQNCVAAIYQNLGTEVATAEALGMQRTYISRIMGERKQRIKEEKNERHPR